jgi:peptidoglycan/LPS O-acetylase OafA/YrhL
MVILCASGLYLVSSKDIGAYFSFTWLKYLSANLIFLNFLQPTLPGVFEANRLAAVNGALWTLKVEVMFYLLVPFLVYLFRKFGHLTVLTLLYCLSVAYAGLLAEAAARTGFEIYTVLGRQLPGQLCYFLAGAFFYYFLPLLKRHIGSFLAAAIIALWADMFLPLYFLEPFALATLTIFFGLFFHFGNFAKFGDFSYGIYILHFPVIQLLLHSGWFRQQPWCFVLAITLLTGAGAIIMWHLIEKRFLFRKNHYITSASTRGGIPSETGVAIEAGR